MPVEHITRAVKIDDLALLISAWRWVCDRCGRRDTFPDNPMPEGSSELDAQRRGWKVVWSPKSDGEQCRCPGLRLAHEWRALMSEAVQNTDRELWRERKGDFYSDSIHVTKDGGIGINVGGHVIVMPLFEWHALASGATRVVKGPVFIGAGEDCPGPACACCEQQPKSDCDVPGCAFKGHPIS